MTMGPRQKRFSPARGRARGGEPPPAPATRLAASRSTTRRSRPPTLTRSSSCSSLSVRAAATTRAPDRPTDRKLGLTQADQSQLIVIDLIGSASPHANVAAVAPPNPGFQTVSLPGVPRVCALSIRPSGVRRALEPCASPRVAVLPKIVNHSVSVPWFTGPAPGCARSYGDAIPGAIAAMDAEERGAHILMQRIFPPPQARPATPARSAAGVRVAREARVCACGGWAHRRCRRPPPRSSPRVHAGHWLHSTRQ